MSRLLILLAAVVAALWWLTRRRGERPGASSPRGSQAPAPPPQAMRPCAHCGVHVPQADVLQGADGRPYCSEAHRLAGPR